METNISTPESARKNTDPKNSLNLDDADELESADSFLSKFLLPRKQVNKHLKANHDKLQQLNETVENLVQGFQQCMNTAKICREQTEKIMLDTLDKHALEPAVKTVVELSDELLQLDRLAQKLLKGSEYNQELKTLANEIKISATIAREKHSYLDIKTLVPSRGESLDANRHDVRGHTLITDKALHGRISKLITPGFNYRGKVLRSAKVTVFRYTESNQNKSKKNEGVYHEKENR